MRMRAFLLFFCSMAISAKESDFTLQADGFAVELHTFTLTPGQICRKLDRFDFPQPRAWYTRDTDQTIYLVEDAPGTATPQKEFSAKSPG